MLRGVAALRAGGGAGAGLQHAGGRALPRVMASALVGLLALACASPAPEAASSLPATESPTPSPSPASTSTPEATSRPQRETVAGEAVKQLPWVQDGLEGRELHASILLESIGDTSLPVLKALLSLEREFLPPQSGLDISILEHFLILSTANAALASRAVDVVLSRRGVEDTIAVLALAIFLEGKAPYLISYEFDDWRYEVYQGTADEDSIDHYLLYFEMKEPESFASFSNLSWVTAVTSDADALGTVDLLEVGLVFPDLFATIVEKDWSQDGINEYEFAVLTYLLMLANTPPHSLVDDLLRLADMPILDHVSAVDALAFQAMVNISSRGELHRSRLFGHQVFSTGVGEVEARQLAILGRAIHWDSSLGLIDTIMDHRNNSSETRTVDLEYTRGLALIGISTGGELDNGLDTLERATKEVEGLMGKAFPITTLYLLMSEEVLQGGSFSVGAISGPLTLATDLYTMTHEVAHAYWDAPPLWLREGAAEMLATIVRYQRQNFGGEGPSIFDRGRCEDFANLEEAEGYGGSHGCHYILGLGIFGELYDALGEEEFWRGFRELHTVVDADRGLNVHLEGQRPRRVGRCFGEQQGLCYMKAAFVEAAEPEAAAVADEVITRWYFGTPQEG